MIIFGIKKNSNSKIQLVAKNKSGSLNIFDIYGHIKEWCDAENAKGKKGVKGVACNKNLEKILNYEKRNYYLQYATDDYIGFRICY
jgi:formylglycine-generating enzyme required for sulfatase activity